jgi:sugar/nucleoside kinase (ribokinase family)
MTRTLRLSRRYDLDFFSVGQVTLDTIIDHQGEHGLLPGGGALYPALVAAQLGLRSAVYGKVGSDFPSPALAKLHATGLNIEAIRKVKGKTAKLTIEYLDAFEEKVGIFPGVGYKLSTRELPKALFDSRVIHVSTARASFLESFFEFVCGRERALVSFAPKSDLKQEPPQRVASLFSRVDALFFNEFEIGLYSAAGSMERRLLNIASKGPKVVVVTLGERGSLVCGDQKVYEIEAFRPNLVRSRCGAGDAYLAGFLYAYLRGCSLPDCGGFASRVAVSVMDDYGLPLNTETFARIFSDPFSQEILKKPMTGMCRR